MAGWAWRERAENRRPGRRTKGELVNERTVSFARNFRLQNHEWDNVVFQYNRFNALRTQAYHTAKNRAQSDDDRNNDYASAVADLAIECARHMGVRPPISLIILFTPNSPVREKCRDNLKTIEALQDNTPEDFRLEEMEVFERYFREAHTDVPNTEEDDQPPPGDDDDDQPPPGNDDDDQPPPGDDDEPPPSDDDDEQGQELEAADAIELLDDDEEIEVDYLVPRQKLINIHNNAAKTINTIRSIFRHPHYRNRQEDE